MIYIILSMLMLFLMLAFLVKDYYQTGRYGNKKIYFIFLILVFIFSFLYICDNVTDQSKNGYQTDTDIIWFDGKKIEDADKKTFKKLDNINYYARDSESVYYKGKKLKNTDAESFRVLIHDYTKDKNFIYYKGKKIENADPDTAEPVGRGYIKDKKSVFYNGKVIKDADSATFEELDSMYFTKDKNSVYFMGKRIKKADVDTFEVCTSNLVYENEKTKECNPRTARDKNYIYKVKKSKYMPLYHLSKIIRV
jgi:hypothetical protein